MRSSPYSSVPAKLKLNSENVAGVATTRIIICGPVSTYWVPKDTKLSIKNFREILTEDEMKYADKISTKAEKDEFLRSRWLFHKTFRNAGNLLPAKNGLSEWPEGWTGSLSHKDGHVVLVKAQKTTHEGIGIDIESLKTIKPGFESQVCSESEQSLVEKYLRDPKLDRSDIYIKIFSAKEAVFKTHFVIDKKRFGFLDLEIEDINFIRKEIRMKLKKDTSSKTKKGQSIATFYAYLTTAKDERYVVSSCEERVSQVVEDSTDLDSDDETIKDEAS